MRSRIMLLSVAIWELLSRTSAVAQRKTQIDAGEVIASYACIRALYHLCAYTLNDIATPRRRCAARLIAAPQLVCVGSAGARNSRARDENRSPQGSSDRVTFCPSVKSEG